MGGGPLMDNPFVKREIIGSEECPDCGGTGDGTDGWYCRFCNGAGERPVYAPDAEEDADA
jgi:DnaJ-class molecular chaperone